MVKNKQNPFISKTIATYGDSVTWYDGEHYFDSTTTPNEEVVGYQSYFKRDLEVEVINKGVSGDTTAQIFKRLKEDDLNQYDMLTIFSGINDFRDHSNLKFGEIKEIGAEFDETTFLGSYQGMLEHIQLNFPCLVTLMIIPFKVWTVENGLMPVKYRDKLVELANLYSIPYCDLYYQSGFTELTFDTFISDTDEVPYKFHPSFEGYKQIANHLVPFVRNHFIG